MIGTGAVLIHKAVLKLHSKVIFVFLLYFQFPFLAILLMDKECNKFVVHQITIIKHILYRLAVNGKQRIPWFQFQFLPDTAGNHFGYNV